MAEPIVIPVSEWYSSLSNFTFPTVFIRLNEAEIAAFLNEERQSAATKGLIDKLDYVIEHLPGSCFVHADVCAPSDSDVFVSSDGAVKRGRLAWNSLRQSAKVRAALGEGLTERFAVHPFRRMDHGREFRMFIKGRDLVAMSQRFLRKYHARLHARNDEIWRLAKSMVAQIGDFLPREDLTVDVYLTASGKLMLLDMDVFGEPTDPLLLRDWDQDWSSPIGLKLMPKPTRLGGDVSVSF